MRILHVTPYFAPAFCYGGPPRTILGLCQAERRLGMDVTVFTTTAGGRESLPPAVDKPAGYEEIPVFRFPLGLAGRFFHAPKLAGAITNPCPRFRPGAHSLPLEFYGMERCICVPGGWGALRHLDSWHAPWRIPSPSSMAQEDLLSDYRVSYPPSSQIPSCDLDRGGRRD